MVARDGCMVAKDGWMVAMDLWMVAGSDRWLLVIYG